MNTVLKSLLIFVFVVNMALLAGCKKTGLPESSAPVQVVLTAPEEGTAPQEQAPTAFDYQPGDFNAYLTIEPNEEVSASVLDALEMTLPEGVSRRPVSSCQLDFVKEGKQVGGIFVMEIPQETLQKAAESEQGLLEMADYVAKQVMKDVYPELTHLNGGGAGIKGEYARFFVEANDERTQYKHCIYLGQQYCYDFWTDQSWWGDSGYGVQDSLSGGELQLEENQVPFAWS